MTREEFAKLLKERNALRGVSPTTEPGKTIAEEHRLAVCATIKATGSRAKQPKIWEDADSRAVKILGKEKANEIAAPFKARIEVEQAKVDEERKRIDAVLDDAAPGLVGEIRKTTEPMVVFDFLYGGTYTSQGYGAHSYSTAHLNRIGTNVVAQYGVAFKIEEAPGGWNVLVNVESEMDIEIMKRAAQPVPLREFVRRCWAQGVNPRVMNPFIPVGFEEEQGLDYFGHDLRVEPDAGPYRKE